MERTLGHLALHYRPGDEKGSRRLLEMCGYQLVDNGPSPGKDGFCTVLLDPGSANHAENIMFMSPAGAAQLALEKVLDEKLRIGQPDEDPVASEFRTSKYAKPESTAHIGVRFGTFEDLEQTVMTIEKAGRPGGELAGRVDVTKFKARPGLDPAIDERIAASPMFGPDDKPAFANYWVQCFVRTDLFGHGLLTFGQILELDYVFPQFFSHLPPKFG